MLYAMAMGQIKMITVRRLDILEIESSSCMSHAAARYEGTSAHWIIVKRRTARRRSGSARTGPDRTGELAWWTDLPMRYDDVVTDVLPHSQPSPSSSASSSLLLPASEAALPTSSVANWYSALVVSRVINSHSARANIRHRYDANYHAPPPFHPFNLQC